MFLYYIILNKHEDTVHNYTDFIIDHKLSKSLYKLLVYSTSFYKFDKFTDYPDKMLKIFYNDILMLDTEQIFNIITKIKKQPSKLSKTLYENNVGYVKVKTLLKYHKNTNIKTSINSIKYNNYNNTDILSVLQKIETINMQNFINILFNEYHPDSKTLNEIFIYITYRYKPFKLNDELLECFINNNLDVGYTKKYILKYDDRVNQTDVKKSFDKMIDKMIIMQRKNKINKLIK